MKGLELAKRFYEAYGEALLREFPEVMPHVAVAVAGPGSEWLGFDDETSVDHDFGPGFTVFLPGEEIVTRRQEFLLERAYSRLPLEFMGYAREKMSPVGGNRFGVRRMADFFRETVGTEDGTLSAAAFLSIPEQCLLEATNGAVFYDGDGIFSAIREKLSELPEDVRLKKLAGELVTAGQAGPYNYGRSVSHGEAGAAALALGEFAKAVLHVAFLLNRRYMPYYKWSFRAARDLERFSAELSPEKLAETLTKLLTDGAAGRITDGASGGAQELLEFLVRETYSAVTETLSGEGYRMEEGFRSFAASNPYSAGAFGQARENGEKSTTDPDAVPDLGRLAETVNAVKNPARPLARFDLPGLTVKVIVPRWENGGVTELVLGEMQAGKKLTWGYHPCREQYYVRSGRVKLTLFGEERIAKAGCIINVPILAPFTLEALEDAAVYDVGGQPEWFSFLLDYDSLRTYSPERLSEALPALMERCGVAVTDLN